MRLSRYLVPTPLFSCIAPNHGRLIGSWQLSPVSLEEACVNHVCPRDVTPIDSIVTAVTADQNFDQLFSTSDQKYMEECIATPHFLSTQGYGVKMCGRSCDY